MTDTQRTLHQCYSEVFYSANIHSSDAHRKARQDGMRALQRVWYRLFGTAMPRPVDY